MKYVKAIELVELEDEPTNRQLIEAEAMTPREIGDVIIQLDRDDVFDIVEWLRAELNS
jgi:hypothetical protein